MNIKRKNQDRDNRQYDDIEIKGYKNRIIVIEFVYVFNLAVLIVVAIIGNAVASAFILTTFATVVATFVNDLVEIITGAYTAEPQISLIDLYVGNMGGIVRCQRD